MAQELKVGRFWEKFFICVFLLSYSLIPLRFPSFFPFSSMPMFSAFPERFCLLKIRELSGKSIHPGMFYLHNAEIINPNPRLGRKLAPSFWKKERLLSRDELEALLLKSPNFKNDIVVEQKLLEKDFIGRNLVITESREDIFYR